MEGLYNKYVIKKVDGTPMDEKADYFVLRLDKDKEARKALLIYAIFIQEQNPKLYDDILFKLACYGNR